MKIAWITDPHLDRVPVEALRRLAERSVRDRPDVLVVTGDISTAPHLGRHLKDLATLTQVPLAFVLGNHDYYGSSLAKVRKEAAGYGFAGYLPAKGLLRLAPTIALVGVDGWGDTRNGVLSAKPLTNDALHIEELRLSLMKGTGRMTARLKALGVAEGKRLDALLTEAVPRYRIVVIATHVPPFPEAVVWRGETASPRAVPYFSCGATGEVILKHALHNPRVHFEVLCGHTHGETTLRRRTNLTVRVGAASSPQTLTLLPADS